MDALLHPRGKGEYKKKTSVTIAPVLLDSRHVSFYLLYHDVNRVL
jgi:hypothetical protein